MGTSADFGGYVGGLISSALAPLVQPLEAIGNFMSAIGQGIADVFGELKDGFLNMVTKLGELLSSVGGWFADLGTSLGGWFLDLGTKMVDGFTNMIEGITNIWDEILAIPEKFKEMLLGLFVPSESWEGFTPLLDTFKQKFPFLFEVQEAVKSFTQQGQGNNRLTIAYEGVNLVPYDVLDKQVTTFMGTMSVIELLKIMMRVVLWTFFFGWLMNTFKPVQTIA